jgi:hypothetical protein
LCISSTTTTSTSVVETVPQPNGYSHTINKIAHVSSRSLHIGAVISALWLPFDIWPKYLRRISGALGLRKRDNDRAVCPSVSLLSYDIPGTQADLSAAHPYDDSNYLRQTLRPPARRHMCYTSNVHRLQYTSGTICLRHRICRQLILVYIPGIQHKICSGYGCRVTHCYVPKLRTVRDAFPQHRRRTFAHDTSRSIVRPAPNRFCMSASTHHPTNHTCEALPATTKALHLLVSLGLWKIERQFIFYVTEVAAISG